MGETGAPLAAASRTPTDARSAAAIRSHVRSPSAVRQPAWRDLAAVAAAGLLLGCLLLAGQILRLGSEPTAPFVVGTSWGLDEALAARGLEVTTTAGHGYDGQWFLGLAYDPLLGQQLAASFDMPRYRAGRPLQAFAGWLLAGGRPGAIPVGLLAVGPLAVALGCAASGRLLAGCGRSRWWGLGFALVPGVAVGVAFATAEPLALALATLGLSLTLDRRVMAGGLAYAGAALTKESYLVFAVVAAAWLALGAGRRVRGWGEAAAVVVPGVLVMGLWWAYVAWRIPASGGDSEALGAIGPPVAGWLHAVGLVIGGDYVPDAPVGPLGAALLVGSLVLIAAAILVGLRRTTLLNWTGLVLGAYGLLLSGELLGRFLSSMRALAPTILAACLAVGAGLASTANSTCSGRATSSWPRLDPRPPRRSGGRRPPSSPHAS